MKETTKKPAAKSAEKGAEKTAEKKPKAAPKGTSTKGPTKSAASSTTKPKPKPDQQPPSAFSKPLTPSKDLAAVLGSPDPLPRTVVVSKVWEYIKEHKLQNEQNKREILSDAKLKAVFGKEKVTMFEMNKHLAAHLKG